MPNGHVRAAAPGLPAAQTTSADPMLDIITRWRDALDRFNATSVGPDLDDSASAKLASATWQPVLDDMVAGTPRTESFAGALAAIELVARDVDDNIEPWHRPFLASALDYLRRSEPKQRAASEAPAHATYISEAFAGPGLYLFEDAPSYLMFRDRGRIWRVEARLRPPLPPEDVQYELYPVDGSSDGPILIMPPRSFDAAMPRHLGDTVAAAVHVLLADIETDFGVAKALNHAVALAGGSGRLGADSVQDQEVFSYLTAEVDRILDRIDACHTQVAELAFAARDRTP